jgi:hypothetical protein
MLTVFYDECRVFLLLYGVSWWALLFNQDEYFHLAFSLQTILLQKYNVLSFKKGNSF